MSFGDPDFKPSKAKKRQEITQNADLVRLCFKARCSECNGRLVKSSYYVPKSADPEVFRIHKDFYSVDHKCAECATGPLEFPKPDLTDHGGIRYRGRGG